MKYIKHMYKLPCPSSLLTYLRTYHHSVTTSIYLSVQPFKKTYYMLCLLGCFRVSKRQEPKYIIIELSPANIIHLYQNYYTSKNVIIYYRPLETISHWLYAWLVTPIRILQTDTGNTYTPTICMYVCVYVQAVTPND